MSVKYPLLPAGQANADEWLEKEKKKKITARFVPGGMKPGRALTGTAWLSVQQIHYTTKAEKCTKKGMKTPGKTNPCFGELFLLAESGTMGNSA